MKNLTFLLLIAILSVSFVSATITPEHSVIDLTLNYVNPTNEEDNKRPRTPILPPIVYQHNNVIMFEALGFCNSIDIVDINTEEIVYTKLVTSTDSLFILPTYLNGMYEIRFYNENYYYVGVIKI